MKHRFVILLAGLAVLGLSAAARSQVATAASPLRSFDWTYVYGPEPGARHWSSPDGITWTETYPSGRTEVQKVVGFTQRSECHGVITVKAYAPTSQTLIPDPGCQQMDLQFRSQDGPWHELGAMRAISTAYGQWSSEPAVLRRNINGCTGWAEGPWGERVDVSIRRGTGETAWADWTPPRLGAGPMSLRLTYGVRGGHLTNLKQALVEGDPGPLYTGDRGYVTVKTAEADYVTVRYDYSLKPAAKSIWRLPLRADRSGAFQAENDASAPLATALLASDRPRNLIQALTFWRRLQIISRTEGLEIAAFGRDDGQFSHSGYDISNRPGFHNDLYHGDRDDLFAIADARAIHGLRAGCAPMDSKCECGG